MMVVKASLALGLQESVGNFWQGDNDFCDCIVTVENTTFKCHRFILSACSSFFQRLFRSQMKESLEDVVYLQEMSKITFVTILNSIYKGVDGLTEDNILDVWSATEFLQIDYLIKECKNFAGHNISLDNWCRTLSHAVMYSAQNVIDDCLDFIAKNFEKVKNEGSFLQMTFDYFYQVIESDYLVADYEDSVVETILKWVNYKPGLERSQWLFCGTLENKAASERQPQANILQHDLPLSDSQENYSNGQKNENDCSEKQLENLKIGNEKQEKGNEQTDLRNNENSSLLECVEDKMENESNTTTAMLVDGETVCNNNDNGQVVCREGDRKQHFSSLLSSCRYLLVKPSCLENLLYNHTQLLVETGTHKLVVKALMYTISVDRQHDCWPEAAIYRTSSPNKHVMVVLSQDNKFMTYSLDTGRVHKVTLQEITNFINGVTVFGNAFYVIITYECGMQRMISKKQRLAMLTTQKQWLTINEQEMYALNLLLAHDNYIYGLCKLNLLYRCACIHGQNMQWSQVCTLAITPNCLVRFHQYIVLFSTQYTTVTAWYYNPENHQVLQSPRTLDGTSEDMESFTHRGDVYILQINGTLWKLFGTDTTPVDFELVSKLWDCDCSLKGCILYKNVLVIFCDESKVIPDLLVTSLPGLCENIIIIKVMNKMTRCLPMVLHESWFTS